MLTRGYNGGKSLLLKINSCGYFAILFFTLNSRFTYLNRGDQLRITLGFMTVPVLRLASKATIAPFRTIGALEMSRVAT